MVDVTSEARKCPCGSEKDLSTCCLSVIQGKRKAQTAEEMLRARYTAFTLGEIDFILSSHHSRTRAEIKREEVEDWSKNSEWLGLKILETQEGSATDEKGTVTFHTQYKADNKINDHYEQSLFEKENGEWRFVDAKGLKAGPIRRTEPKVGRNDPCPCGSNKKYKKCCGR